MFDKYVTHDYSKVSYQMEKDRKSRELIAEKELKTKDRVDISIEEYEKMKSQISNLQWENNRIRGLFKHFEKFVEYNIIPDSIFSMTTRDTLCSNKSRCRIEFDFIQIVNECH